MTHREAIALSLAAWVATYPNLKLAPETPRAWEELLSDLEPGDIIQAFREALLKSEVAALPGVGTVRAIAKRHAEARRAFKESQDFFDMIQSWRREKLKAAQGGINASSQEGREEY